MPDHFWRVADWSAIVGSPLEQGPRPYCVTYAFGHTAGPVVIHCKSESTSAGTAVHGQCKHRHLDSVLYIQPAPSQKLGAYPSFLDLSHLPSTHGSFYAATPRNASMWVALNDISFCHCHTNL